MSKARRRSAEPTHAATTTPSESAQRSFVGPVVANRPYGEMAGDAASDEQMIALRKATQALKFRALAPLLNKALDAVNAEDYARGTELGLQALAKDPELGLGWHILGVCREKAADFPWALRCYKSAFELMPGQTEIAHDLGRLAQSMGRFDVAEQFYRLRIATAGPCYLDSVNNLALMQKEALRYAEAIETLRPYLALHPDSALLWNALGGVLFEQGDSANADIFFTEALRFDPKLGSALYNRSNVRASMGDRIAALADVDRALEVTTKPVLRVQFELGRAFRRLDLGDLEGGWRSYEARRDPGYGPNQLFDVALPAWTCDMPLDGARLLVVAEQGLGDEIMFASVIPEVLEALGPEGALTIAAEPRLVGLFRRTWPRARVTPHRTINPNGRILRYVPDAALVADHDVWVPMATLLGRFRPTIEAFPPRQAFLVPDADRVRGWREALAHLGSRPKVGIVWKSIKIASDRTRLYSPFAAWEPILRTAGITFVDLQYGAHDEDIAYARDRFGVEIWRPPELDLKDDLEGVAALARALDLAIGPANAATNLAAATGLESWMIATPGDWHKLGTDGFPWYPRARVFTPATPNVWGPVMAQIGEALAVWAARGRSPP